MTQSLRTTTIVKVWDAEYEWWVERVIRKAYAQKNRDSDSH
ncbi:MAG: hypothetical protein ACLQAT_27295 [Candidatus Binataceae bacterium]